MNPYQKMSNQGSSPSYVNKDYSSPANTPNSSQYVPPAQNAPYEPPKKPLSRNIAKTAKRTVISVICAVGIIVWLLLISAKIGSLSDNARSSMNNSGNSTNTLSGYVSTGSQQNLDTAGTNSATGTSSNGSQQDHTSHNGVVTTNSNSVTITTDGEISAKIDEARLDGGNLIVTVTWTNVSGSEKMFDTDVALVVTNENNNDTFISSQAVSSKKFEWLAVGESQTITLEYPFHSKRTQMDVGNTLAMNNVAETIDVEIFNVAEKGDTLKVEVGQCQETGNSKPASVMDSTEVTVK